MGKSAKLVKNHGCLMRKIILKFQSMGIKFGK